MLQNFIYQHIWKIIFILVIFINFLIICPYWTLFTLKLLMPGLGGAIGAGFTYYLLKISFIHHEEEKLKLFESIEKSRLILGLRQELELIMDIMTEIHEEIENISEDGSYSDLNNIVIKLRELSVFLQMNNFKAYTNYNQSNIMFSEKLHKILFVTYFELIKYGTLFSSINLDETKSDEEIIKASLKTLKALEGINYIQYDKKVKNTLEFLNQE
jgi:hypothetical protein